MHYLFFFATQPLQSQIKLPAKEFFRDKPWWWSTPVENAGKYKRAIGSGGLFADRTVILNTVLHKTLDYSLKKHYIHTQWLVLTSKRYVGSLSFSLCLLYSIMGHSPAQLVTQIWTNSVLTGNTYCICADSLLSYRLNYSMWIRPTQEHLLLFCTSETHPAFVYI